MNNLTSINLANRMRIFTSIEYYKTVSEKVTCSELLSLGIALYILVTTTLDIKVE